MARKPKYRRQRRADRPDLAFVELNGSRFYLGEYGTVESRSEYRRLLAEWEGRGRSLPVASSETTVWEVAAGFLKHAESYYRRPDGSPTSELGNFKNALRILKEHYGHAKADSFGPRALRAVRSSLIEKGLARTTVNATVRRIRAIFKWAVAEEIVSSSVYERLRTLDGLRRGRSKARETEPVRPVPAAHVEAVAPYLSRQLWTVVQIQRLTGARSGEILYMRPCDIDMGDDVWACRPAEHKTSCHGHERVIYLGSHAQALLRPFLGGRALNAYLFSPKEAEEERRRKRHALRRTPASQGHRPGTNKAESPRWRPGDCYDKDSYRKAIARACRRAGVPAWHPHQLRHARATELRKEYGLEVARVILGHRSPVITAHYAELDHERAVDVVRKSG